MRFLLFAVTVIIASCNQLPKKRIVIEGTLQSKSKAFIELKVRNDFITPSSKSITVVETDDGGQFNIQFDADKTQTYDLLVGEKSNRVYLCPGFLYDVQINPDYEVILIKSTDSTNYQIDLIDTKIREFFARHKSSSYDESTLAAISSFSRFDLSTSNSFVINYHKYSLATLQFRYYKSKFDIENLNEIELTYFEKSPVDFWNPKYFTLLSLYYWETFNSPDLGHVPFSREAEPFDLYQKELSFITNDTVRQVATLKACRNAFRSSWGGEKGEIIEVVNSINDSSLNFQISDISDNLITKYGDPLVGETPPDFALTTLDSKRTQISDFKGTYVLLDFWYVGCRPCMKAMPTKKLLADSLSNVLEVVSINPRNDPSTVKEWLMEYPDFNWTFLSAYKNQSVLDFFQINGYPTYILLDESGEIVWTPNAFDLESMKNDLISRINN